MTGVGWSLWRGRGSITTCKPAVSARPMRWRAIWSLSCPRLQTSGSPSTYGRAARVRTRPPGQRRPVARHGGGRPERGRKRPDFYRLAVCCYW